MRDGKQSVADEAQMLWLKRVGVSARDDNVIYDWVRRDVVEHSLPATKDGLERGFSDGRGIGSDGIRTGAETAIKGTVR